MGTRPVLFLLTLIFFSTCNSQYDKYGAEEAGEEAQSYAKEETESYAKEETQSYAKEESQSYAQEETQSYGKEETQSGGEDQSSNVGETFSASDITSLEVDGMSVNDPGMDATSKACRYDEGHGWSDCDPFELIKFRVLRLVHGGSQCEEMKNITRHCTPHDFPYGTHWLIQEHRKCISELNRLKSMIADLYKFIETMHSKGKELFAAYMKLKSKLALLTEQLEKLKNDGAHQQEILTKLREEIEEWKAKARDLQVELDEIRAKYHDLQAEDHELTLRNKQLTAEINVLTKENEGIQKRIEKMTRENEELKRRILESVRVKEQLADLKVKRDQLSSNLEGLTETLQGLRDKLAESKLEILSKKLEAQQPEDEDGDTHVDLSMEMFITHNKSAPTPPEPIYFATEGPPVEEVEEIGTCLISYYGATNETCWYETEGEQSEDEYVDALGHHLVEAHWKYFTINVKDQPECDKASQLHYEFLLNRCSPKHYLPVLSVFRPNAEAKELGTHVYPKVSSHGTNACWVTFLGAHGHCEAFSNKYDLYNTPDNEDPSASESKEACLSRAQWWMKYCDTPVIMTYVPDEVSTSWHEDWIMHDSHGGRMFEEAYSKNQINPDSLKPHSVDASKYKSEYRSMDPKSPDYHDSPEYRKSLHLQGAEKESVLASLRQRLGMSGPARDVSNDVKHHLGVDTGVEMSDMSSSSFSSSSSSGFEQQEESETTYKQEETPYEEPKQEEIPYEEPKQEETPYEEPRQEETPYEEPEQEETPYEEPKQEENPYEEPEQEENPYEEPKQEEAPEEQYEPEENPYEETEPENPYEEAPEEPADPYGEAPKYDEPEPDNSAEKY